MPIYSNFLIYINLESSLPNPYPSKSSTFSVSNCYNLLSNLSIKISSKLSVHKKSTFCISVPSTHKIWKSPKHPLSKIKTKSNFIKHLKYLSVKINQNLHMYGLLVYLLTLFSTKNSIMKSLLIFLLKKVIFVYKNVENYKFLN